MLQEAVYANTCVYVALLDVKKAFDTVWINGMLYKLIKLGVDKRLLRIISDSYNGFQCTVRVCGLFWAPAVTVGETEGAMDSTSIYLFLPSTSF